MTALDFFVIPEYILRLLRLRPGSAGSMLQQLSEQQLGSSWEQLDVMTMMLMSFELRRRSSAGAVIW